VDNQIRKAQFQRLIEEFGMIGFPLRHSAVEGFENAADLFQGWRVKTAAVFAVKFLDLRAGHMQVCNTTTGVEPEFLPLGRVPWRLNQDCSVWRFSICARLLTVGGRDRTVRLEVAVVAWEELLLPSLFVCHVHTRFHERV